MNLQDNYYRFCNDWLNSWTGNQPLKLLDFYAEDIFYLDPANPSGIEGRVKLLLYFEKLLAKNPEWKWQTEEIIPTEKGFTLKWKAAIHVKGKILVLYGLDIVELNAHKISRNEVYFDRSPWMELLHK